MSLWHEHEDGFVGTHTHATDENPAEFEHTHGDDRAVTTAGPTRWKQAKDHATAETVTLDVQSTSSGSATRTRR